VGESATPSDEPSRLITLSGSFTGMVPVTLAAESTISLEGMSGSRLGESSCPTIWSEGLWLSESFMVGAKSPEFDAPPFFFLVACTSATRSRRPPTRAQSFFMSTVLPIIFARREKNK